MSKSILSPVLTLVGWSDFYTNEESGWDFCRSDLRRYFEIPAGAKQIQFRAFDEPGPGRTKVKFVHYTSVPPLSATSGVLVDGDKNLREYLVGGTQDAIKKLAGRRKIWYVDVYYWE